MDLERTLAAIVTSALPHLDSSAVSEIVTYLMSADVGVVNITDLKDLSLELMPETIPPLKRRQLLNALVNHSTTEAGEGTASGSSNASSAGSSNAPAAVNERRPLAPLRTNFTSSSKPKFEFRIVWDDMPPITVKKLEASNRAKETADINDVSHLKLAIAKKIVSSYKAFRISNPGTQLSPGRDLYSNVTLQVFSKFNRCLKVEVNGKIMGPGEHTFNHLLEVCVGNLLRKCNDTNRSKKRVSAKKGKGLVGVKVNEYDPTPKDKDEQEAIKTHLQSYFLLDAGEQDAEEIAKDMAQSYELQRTDIVCAREEVLENDEDEPAREPAIKKLLSEWPFLFRPEYLRSHHNRLTGRNIYTEIMAFIRDRLEIVIQYMTTCSNTNIANMALRLNAERQQHEVDINRLIMALMMVSNHFKEDYKTLIFIAERTLVHALEQLAVEQKEPCLVAFGQDALFANQFAVCADKTPIIICDNEIDAVTSLFEVCFVLDLEYPKLPHTVEFFERYVFSMAFSDTRVENKKGKTVLTLTDGVKRLINGLQNFEDELRKQMEPENQV